MALVAAVDVQRGDTVKPLRVLALTHYGQQGASSRMRSWQYFPVMREAGVHVEAQALIDDATLLDRYKVGSYRLVSVIKRYVLRVFTLFGRHQYDLLWIEKEALPWVPLWFELILLRRVPYVLDFDDAVFHNYDRHRLAVVRRLYGLRLDRLMGKAALVVCGNQYLADRAKSAGAQRVELLPTVIDLARYPAPLWPNSLPTHEVSTIVWIGSPSTARYLQVLQKPLELLAQRVNFMLRIIGAEFHMPGVHVECVPWAEATEVASIAACQVGVMPLQDSAWERGKCGYKLIQYMACGLPVVASPVGVNTQIVEPGVNGFLANSDDEWVSALEQLLTQAQLRQRMGIEGRANVEALYCIQKTGPKMAELLKKAAKGT